MPNGQTLTIFSIFRSINGEINQAGQGSWAAFIRFAGCNLQCDWCDTQYAQSFKGKSMTVDQIMAEVEPLNCSNVLITGGEPLMPNELFVEGGRRKGLTLLLQELIKQRYNISIETNGSHPIIPDLKVSWIVDYKLPSSGENSKMDYIDYWWYQLGPSDYIKFVIADRIDYEIALSVMQNFWSGGVHAQMVFSPMIQNDTTYLFNQVYRWMQENQLFNVLLNVQLHKLIALEEPS